MLFCHPLSFMYFLYKGSNTTKLKGKQKSLYAALAPTPAWGLLLNSAKPSCYIPYTEPEKCPKAQSHPDVLQTRFMVEAIYFNCFITKYISCIVLTKGH